MGHYDVWKQLSSISLMFELMSAKSGTNDSNNSDEKRTTRPTAVLSMVATLVSAAILLSGLSLISNGNYQSAIAQQQNTTEGNGGGASVVSGNNASSTNGGATPSGNAMYISGGPAGSNQSTSELRTNIEQARTALQSNDTQSAMMYLDMALSVAGGGGAAEGNITSSNAAGSSEGNTTSTGGEEGVSVGGTSAADDYDETPDANG
ncbi:MAG: hypothetical protein ACJ70X_04425 [Nitrososphaera sp.]